MGLHPYFELPIIPWSVPLVYLSGSEVSLELYLVFGEGLKTLACQKMEKQKFG